MFSVSVPNVALVVAVIYILCLLVYFGVVVDIIYDDPHPGRIGRFLQSAPMMCVMALLAPLTIAVLIAFFLVGVLCLIAMLVMDTAAAAYHRVVNWMAVSR